jgi:hypothetical protein
MVGDRVRLWEWFAELADVLEPGDIPSQAQLSEWVSRHTLGLIGSFPLRMRPESALLLASALPPRRPARCPSSPSIPHDSAMALVKGG